MDIRYAIQMIFWTKWKEQRLDEATDLLHAALRRLEKGNPNWVYFTIAYMKRLDDLFI